MSTPPLLKEDNVQVTEGAAPDAAPRPGAGAERPHPIRRVAKGFVSVVLAGMVGGAVAVSLVPAVTGGSAMTVLSGSMTPTLPVGSVVVVRPRPADQIEPGDVITFTDRDPDLQAPRVVTHRVVAVEQGPGGLMFRTKGDANNTPDQRPAAAADVHGVLWYSVPLAGSLREFLVSPAGLCLIAGVLLLMVAGHVLLPKTPVHDHSSKRAPSVTTSAQGAKR